MEWLLAAAVAGALVWILFTVRRHRAQRERWRNWADEIAREVERAPPATPVSPRILRPLPPTTPPVAAEPIRIIEEPKKRRKVRQAKATAAARLIFFDVETTGLSRDDRVVSLGLFGARAVDLLKKTEASYTAEARTLHLVFNPERPNDPRAERVHGWSGDVLARQPRFASAADQIADMDIWLAHSVSFDVRFLRQEFERVGRPLKERKTFCTMEEAKKFWPGQTAKLDQCARRIGLKRASIRHGAMEDTLLCAALYTFYQTGNKWRSIPECGPPTNYVG